MFCDLFGRDLRDVWLVTVNGVKGAVMLICLSPADRGGIEGQGRKCVREREEKRETGAASKMRRRP